MFHEIQLNPEYMYGIQGGPRFSTLIQPQPNGQEQRFQQWPIGRHEYTVGYEAKSRSDLRSLLHFFWGRAGQAYGWRLKDPFDYTATNSPVILASDGLTGQLVKAYGDVAATRIRPITKPVLGPTDTWPNSTITLSGQTGSWACNYALGLVTFSVSQTGRTITWSGEHDVPARFKEDWMQQERSDFDATNWQGIGVIEVKDIT